MIYFQKSKQWTGLHGRFKKSKDLPDTWAAKKEGKSLENHYNPLAGDLQRNFQHAKKVAKEMALFENQIVSNTKYYKSSYENVNHRSSEDSSTHYSLGDDASTQFSKLHSYIPVDKEAANVLKLNKETDKVHSEHSDHNVDGIQNFVAVNDVNHPTYPRNVIPHNMDAIKNAVYHQNQVTLSQNGGPVQLNNYNVGGKIVNNPPRASVTEPPNTNNVNLLTSIDDNLSILKKLPAVDFNSLNPANKRNLLKQIKILEILKILEQKGYLNRIYQQKILRILGTPNSKFGDVADIMNDNELTNILNQVSGNLNPSAQNELQKHTFDLQMQSIPKINPQFLNSFQSAKTQILNHAQNSAYSSNQYPNYVIKDANEILLSDQQSHGPINSNILALSVNQPNMDSNPNPNIKKWLAHWINTVDNQYQPEIPQNSEKIVSLAQNVNSENQQSESHLNANPESMWLSHWINSVDYQHKPQRLQNHNKKISNTPTVLSENQYYTVDTPYDETNVLRSMSKKVYSLEKQDDFKEGYKSNEFESNGDISSERVDSSSNRKYPYTKDSSMISFINNLKQNQREYTTPNDKLPNQKSSGSYLNFNEFNKWKKGKSILQDYYAHNTTSNSEATMTTEGNLKDFNLVQNNQNKLLPVRDFAKQKKISQNYLNMLSIHPHPQKDSLNLQNYFGINPSQPPPIIKPKKLDIPFQQNNGPNSLDPVAQLFQKLHNGPYEEFLEQIKTDQDKPSNNLQVLQNINNVVSSQDIPAFKKTFLPLGNTDQNVSKIVLINLKRQKPEALENSAYTVNGNQPFFGNTPDKGKYYIISQNGKKLLIPVQQSISPENIKHLSEYNPNDNIADGNFVLLQSQIPGVIKKLSRQNENIQKKITYAPPNTNIENTLYGSPGLALYRNKYSWNDGKKVIPPIPEIISPESLQPYQMDQNNDVVGDHIFPQPQNPVIPNEMEQRPSHIENLMQLYKPTLNSTLVQEKYYIIHNGKKILLPTEQNHSSPTTKYFSGFNLSDQNNHPANGESVPLESQEPETLQQQNDLNKIIKNLQSRGVPNANIQNLLSLYQNKPSDTEVQKKYYVLQNGKEILLPLKLNLNKLYDSLLQSPNRMGLKNPNSQIQMAKIQQGIPNTNIQNIITQNGKQVLLPIQENKSPESDKYLTDLNMNNQNDAIVNGKKILLQLENTMQRNPSNLYQIMKKQQIYGIQNGNLQYLPRLNLPNLANIAVQHYYYIIQNGKKVLLPIQKDITSNNKYVTQNNPSAANDINANNFLLPPQNNLTPLNSKLYKIIKNQVIYATPNAYIKSLLPIPIYQPNFVNNTVQQKYYIIPNGKWVPVEQSITPENNINLAEKSYKNPSGIQNPVDNQNILPKLKPSYLPGLQNGNKVIVPMQQNDKSINMASLLNHKPINKLPETNMNNGVPSNSPSQFQYIIENGKKVLVPVHLPKSLNVLPIAVDGQLFGKDNQLNRPTLGSNLVQNSDIKSKYYGNNIFVPGGHLPSSFTWPSVTNLNKLNYVSPNTGVIEITYIVKPPNPLVFEPYYYVKYRYPANVFASNIHNILQRKPYLRDKALDIYEELTANSKIAEVSPDLKYYTNNDIHNLIHHNRTSYIETKILNNKDKILDKQIKPVDELNSKLGFNNILRTLDTIKSLNSEKRNEDTSGNDVNQNEGKVTGLRDIRATKNQVLNNIIPKPIPVTHPATVLDEKLSTHPQAASSKTKLQHLQS